MPIINAPIAMNIAKKYRNIITSNDAENSFIMIAAFALKYIGWRIDRMTAVIRPTDGHH
jgi:hypothetical protein